MELSATHPFAFEVTIDDLPGGPRSFSVTGIGTDGRPRSSTYNLGDSSHREYLGLFEALGRDFSLRMPLGRIPAGTQQAPPGLRALLTENLVPEILYGYGDPSVLRVAEPDDLGSTYYLVVTSNDAPHSFPILSSQDLTDWTVEGFAFPSGAKPGWAAANGQGAEYWAPEIHEVGSEYLLCFAARQPNGVLAIGLATAATPKGPFAAHDAPILTGGVIDPHIHVGRNGNITLFWKEDSNDKWPSKLAAVLHAHPEITERLFSREVDRRTASFAALLSPWIETRGPMERFLALQTLIEAVLEDFAAIRARIEDLQCEPQLAATLGEVVAAMTTKVFGQQLDPQDWRLLGKPTVVLENDLEWEGHLVEGTWIWEEGESYYIIYSANDFSTAKYGIGVGIGSSPLGPFKKQKAPLLRSTTQWWGLGHPSVARAPDGQAHLFLHGFRRGHVGYKEFRALLDVPLLFADGGVAAGRERR